MLTIYESEISFAVGGHKIQISTKLHLLNTDQGFVKRIGLKTALTSEWATMSTSMSGLEALLVGQMGLVGLVVLVGLGDVLTVPTCSQCSLNNIIFLFLLSFVSLFKF